MLLNIEEASAYSGLSKSTLRNYMRPGNARYLRHLRIGRCIRIRREDFDAWLDQFLVDGSTEQDHIQAAWNEVVEEVQ